MVKQVIDTTGTSTSLPSGGNVINSNFTELYNFISTVASGATANDTDANLRNRAMHTGTVPIGGFGDGVITEGKFDSAVVTKLNTGGGTGNVTAANNFSEYSATLTAARAGLGLAIGTDVQGYTAALAGTTASYTTTIDGEVTTLRTDVDAFGLLIAELTPTVRNTSPTDLTTDNDFNVTILMAEGHTVSLHSVADTAREGQIITFRLRGATQRTISPGTATIEGAAIIKQHDDVVAKLIVAGAGAASIWAMTGGSAS